MSRRDLLPATFVAAAFAVSACAPARPAPVSAPVPVLEVTEPLGSLGETGSLVEARVEVAKRDLLGGASYELPVEANSWVEAELDFLVGQRRDVIARWMQRGDYYEPFIRSVLRDHGLPGDLYYLGMIESAYLPTARSRAGAVGFWQFMPGTGRMMGLRVDGEVDERMDPVRSTRAAARHLRGLLQEMGDWKLVAAAYNAGTGRISRGMASFAVSNYWELAQYGDLAEETKHYVPRLFAMTIIAKQREHFGFAPPAGGARFAYDSIQVEYATPLDELARIVGVSLDELRSLNPHLLARTVPSGGYWVWVPEGRGVEAQRSWLASDFRREQGYGSYTVRRGNTLGELAEHSGVTRRRLRELNPKVDWDRLQIGERLRMPYKAARTLAARPVEEPRKAKATESKSDEAKVAARESGAEKEATSGAEGKSEKQESRVASSEAKETKSGSERKPASSSEGSAAKTAARTHEVKSGETLSGIAERYEVTVAAIQGANDLKGSIIQPGQKLKIPQAASSAGRVAATRAKADTAHVVRSGETLWAIARRYGTTVDALQSANELEKGPIRPGMRLTIPN